MPYFDDYKVGTRVLSKNNRQPATVVRVHAPSGQFRSNNTFTVEWDRHPGKFRTYDMSSDELGPHNWPSIMTEAERKEFPDPNAKSVSKVRPELHLVDSSENARHSVKRALLANLQAGPNGNPQIDLSLFTEALQAAGWKYEPSLSQLSLEAAIRNHNREEDNNE